MRIALGYCDECGEPQPGPHKGTCSHSMMRGGGTPERPVDVKRETLREAVEGLGDLLVQVHSRAHGIRHLAEQVAEEAAGRPELDLSEEAVEGVARRLCELVRLRRLRRAGMEAELEQTGAVGLRGLGYDAQAGWDRLPEADRENWRDMAAAALYLLR